MAEIKTPKIKKEKTEVKTENTKPVKTGNRKQDPKMKVANKSHQSSFVNEKDNQKMKELKIELLKQTSKKKDIRREIARLFTLQNKNIGANK
jgi:hypothetical protein